ncbi:MAG: type I methionyl aminopeptidase [Solirubrobacterales bacterium]
MIVRKSPEELDKMAAAGAIHARTMELIAEMIRPGITTAQLDHAAEKYIRSQGAVPSFKGYRDFPGAICASPNSLVVHGIPGDGSLAEGDIISIDIGVTLDGWVADGACTFAVGEIDPETARMIAATEASLFDAVDQARPGNRIGDISHAVQERVEASGFSVIRTLVGHGVGREMHEDPQVPNYGPAGKGPKLKDGMVLAIEPMVNVGGPGVHMASDGWSVYTDDGSQSAHFEFTVAVTDQGPRILNPWHELVRGRG